MLTIRRVSLADKVTFTDEDIQIDDQTHPFSDEESWISYRREIEKIVVRNLQR